MSRSLALALAVGLALGASDAFAGPREEAVTLADQAFDLMERGRYDAAALKFEKAAELYYSPVIALFWAKAEAKQGKLVEARRIVSIIEKKPVPDDAKPSWKKAVEDASIFGVELDGRIPTVTLHVAGAPAATATLDDRSIAAGEVAKVDPGEHVVVVTSGGEQRTERFRVTEKEAHRVEVDFAGGVAAPEASASLIGPIIAYGVAGVGLVVGTVTGVIFIRKADELEAACPNEICAPESADLLDETTTLGNVSTVAWVIAGLGAAAGTVLLFVPLGEGEDPAIVVRATPVSMSLTLGF